MQQQPLPAATETESIGAAPDALRTRLRAQIEFYFSPQNLSRDTYLRNVLAAYGGLVPLSVIASFPKVRNLCGAPEAGADPRLLMMVMEGSQVASVSPDALWITPLLPIPPLDPTVKIRPTPPVSIAAFPEMPLGSEPMRRLQHVPLAVPSTFVPLGSHVQLVDSAVANTIVLRDLPSDIHADKIVTFFTNLGHTPKACRCDAGNNMWYITFVSEEEAKQSIASSQGLRMEDHEIYACLAPISSSLSPLAAATAASFPTQPPLLHLVNMPAPVMNSGYMYSYPYRPMPSNSPSGYYNGPNVNVLPSQYAPMYPGAMPYRPIPGGMGPVPSQQQRYFQPPMVRPSNIPQPYYYDKNSMRHMNAAIKSPSDANTTTTAASADTIYHNNRTNRVNKKNNSNGNDHGGKSNNHQRGSNKNSDGRVPSTKSHSDHTDPSNSDKSQKKNKNSKNKRDNDRRNDEVTLNVHDFPALSIGSNATGKNPSSSPGFSGYANALLRKNNDNESQEEVQKVSDKLKEVSIVEEKDGDQSSIDDLKNVSSLPETDVSSSTDTKEESPKDVAIDDSNPNQNSNLSTHRTQVAPTVREPESSNSPPVATWGSKRSFIDVVKKS